MIYLPIINGLSTRNISENPKGFRNPEEQGMRYRDVYIRTSDKELLHGWFVFQENSHNFKTIVYFHENAGNIGFRMPLLLEMYRQLKCNILIVAYRGYGHSTGTPSEEGIMIDSNAILNHLFNGLKEEIDSTQVFIFGKSLGGAVAIYACSEFNYRIKGLILENTFASMSLLVDTIMPYVRLLKKYLLKNFWPSIDRVHKIFIPTLFLISENDELIPRNHMEALYSTIRSRFKDKYVIKDGTHNETFTKNREEYFGKVLAFLDSC